MLISKCQRNNRRKQTVPHLPKAWDRVVVGIVVVAVVVAARARP
jgi:hypothetical protein